MVDWSEVSEMVGVRWIAELPEWWWRDQRDGRGVNGESVKEMVAASVRWQKCQRDGKGGITNARRLPSTLLLLSPNSLWGEWPHSVTRPVTPGGWPIAGRNEPCLVASGPGEPPVPTGSLPADISPAPQPGAQRRLQSEFQNHHQPHCS